MPLDWAAMLAKGVVGIGTAIAKERLLKSKDLESRLLAAAEKWTHERPNRPVGVSVLHFEDYENMPACRRVAEILAEHTAPPLEAWELLVVTGWTRRRDSLSPAERHTFFSLPESEVHADLMSLALALHHAVLEDKLIVNRTVLSLLFDMHDVLFGGGWRVVDSQYEGRIPWPMGGRRHLGIADVLDASIGMNFLLSEAALSAGNCLFVIDVDKMTQINRSFGVRIGDAVMHALANLLKQSNANDTFGRCGDDTFFLIKSGDRRSAARRAKELGKAIRMAKWAMVADRLRVTASIGVAVHSLAGGPTHRGEPVAAWVHRAGAAMQVSKSAQAGAFLVADDYAVSSELLSMRTFS